MASLAHSEERVVGRYVLCDEIAAGGMATVHLGRLSGPVGFARIVAIKRLHAHFAKDPEFVAMLLDEARLAARIQHPNVVSTMDVVVQKGEVLVVMDYVQGESLARLERAVNGANERFPLGVAMSIMSGALYGLDAAHNALSDQGQPLGIVHRDVSPQNILVGLDGIARVLDFGVAKAVGRAQTTREGTLKGKLSYMSPEQILGESIDRRSDVYAASVVLWELLCNRRLFQADSEGETINKIIKAKVTPPRQVHPDLPPELDALVMKGLSTEPADRYQTAAEMAEALQRISFATPGDVATWVKRFCGTAIDERAARIAEIESQTQRIEDPTTTYEPRSPRLSSPVITTIAKQAGESQVTDFSAATPAARRRSVAPSVLVALALGVVILLSAGVVVGVLVTRGTGEVPASAPLPSVTAPAPLVAQSTVTVATSPPTTPPSASAAPPVRTSRPPPTPRSKCNPPYTIDANGIRVPKPECL